jgi:two-component system, cell cycle sensor histidine kinase and response regulator CckA
VVTPELDDARDYEALLHAALERMASDPQEMERIVRRVAHAHRLLVIGQMAGSVVHDLNNQLTVVLSAAAHLDEAVKDPALRPAIGEILTAARTAGSTCRQALDLVRQPHRANEPFDLNAVLAGLEPFLARAVAASTDGRISLDVVFSPEPAWIDGDAARFANALLNLALNARDAMPRGGHLVLRTAVVSASPGAGAQPQVCVEVVDTGEGVPPDLLPKVFDPFFTTKADGTGLGLTSVRAAVERHRGTLKFSSKVGEGTAVTILVPLAQPPHGHGSKP